MLPRFSLLGHCAYFYCTKYLLAKRISKERGRGMKHGPYKVHGLFKDPKRKHKAHSDYNNLGGLNKGLLTNKVLPLLNRCVLFESGCYYP